MLSRESLQFSPTNSVNLLYCSLIICKGGGGVSFFLSRELLWVNSIFLPFVSKIHRHLSTGKHNSKE